jgi:hypothetical protein
MGILKGRAEALLYASKIVKQVEVYHTCFTNDELEWVDNYAVELVELTLDGSLFSPNNKDREWAINNFRYGLRSVKGTLSEIMAVTLWNSKSNYDSCRLFPADKASQIGGTDICFTHPSWKRAYVGQVKTTTRNQQEPVIYVNSDWVSYDPEKVDRLVMVDQENDTLYCVDYPKFRELVNHFSHNRPGASLYMSIEMVTDPQLKPRVYSR